MDFILSRFACIVLLYAGTTFAAFGLLDDGVNDFTVDTGANLLFNVSRTFGNVSSIIYNGVELQDLTKPSAINSGFGRPSVSVETLGSDYIKFTVAASSPNVTHYWIAKNGDDAIYMATYAPASMNELRMLFRLQPAVLPTGYLWNSQPVSDIRNGSTIEGGDVYLVDGQTRSKYYSSERFIEDQVHGATGPGVGAWLVMPGTAYETSAGGPFMRDINNQVGEQQEISWYMNSGHVRTEGWRSGLHGPYAMVFNNGSTPSGDLDTSFFSELSIAEYVPESGRGYVEGTTAGIEAGYETVLHWYNNNAQYWTKVSGESYKSPAMKPGTYTVKMYRNEYPVYLGNVDINANETKTQNIESQEESRQVIWQIGKLDGQPFELKNGDKFLRMHPSDSRMLPFGGTYAVGTSQPSDFPMAAFKGGPPLEITFILDTIPTSAKLRISTTLSFSGGRPQVTVNTVSFKAPDAPVKIDSRGVTRGAYRGYGEQYTYVLNPSSHLRHGTNTIKIDVASGSSGSSWLAPSFIFDAVWLEGDTGTVVTPPPRSVTTTTTTTTTVATTASTVTNSTASMSPEPTDTQATSPTLNTPTAPTPTDPATTSSTTTSPSSAAETTSSPSPATTTSSPSPETTTPTVTTTSDGTTTTTSASTTATFTTNPGSGATAITNRLSLWLAIIFPALFLV